MTRDQAIESACQTMTLAYHSIGDYMHESDGFCHRCPHSHGNDFRNAGKTLAYVRAAVVAKLKADGYKIADGFDPETGEEIMEDAP
jgi:hypothetical protein